MLVWGGYAQLTNYERELAGDPPLETPLNRLFLGNPGTGKTTTAELYGRILKGLGFLSDGSVELKVPADLTGSAVGETAEKTSAILANARGKVLVIDEACELCLLLLLGLFAAGLEQLGGGYSGAVLNPTTHHPRAFQTP